MSAPETKPFHETIVDAIRQCSKPTTGEIIRLFEFIKKTTVPANHDAIIAAIDKYFDFPGANKWAREIRLVKEHLLAQKQAAKNKKNDSFDPETIKANLPFIIDHLDDIHRLRNMFEKNNFIDSFCFSLRRKLIGLYELTKKQPKEK